MGETTTLPAPPVTRHDEWFDRRWRLAGALFAAVVLAIATLMVTLGVRPATYGDLLSDVASSKVDEVRVYGFEDPKVGTQVQLRWTVWAGVLDQYADIEVGGSRGYDAWARDTYTSSGDPLDTLRSINPDLRITRVEPTSSFQFAKWEVPGWLAMLAAITWFGVLMLLVNGPAPWRATRWAWAWAMIIGGPLGTVGFLLLGGPLGVLRPRAGRRVLTGGWAFLLFSVVFPQTWTTGF